jgi:pimeloyl-ACP methyl ester carboxylesterase
VRIRPETHYATSGELRIAYQAFGAGPALVWVPGWVSQLDLYWEEPAVERFLRRLASFSRVVVFDRRGIGLSDRVTKESVPSLEERIDDIRAVLDDLGLAQAALLGQGYGTPIALLFVAAGSRIEFQERGVHALRGVPGDWELFAATQAEAD